MSIQCRMPREEYDLIKGVSITRLKEIDRSPLHYRWALTNPRISDALTTGTATHVATLEPERFASTFAVWDRRTAGGNLCPRNGQHWDKFKAEHAGLTILSDDTAQQSLAIANAVRRHEIASEFLAAGEPEVTMQWTVGKREARGRVDWLCETDRPTLVGLKTARDARHDEFSKQTARLGYHLQWAFYHDGFEAIAKVSPRMIEIVVESAAPYAVSVFQIPDDVLAQGRADYVRLLSILDQCEETDYWPAPVRAIEDLTLPTWAYDDENDLSEIGLEFASV